MSINTHPTLPEFDYIRPDSIEEASTFLAEHPGQSRPLSGGTDIFVRMRSYDWKDTSLVDIKHLDGMNEIQFNPAGGLIIGAAVNMNRVNSYPAIRERYGVLAEAANSCASYQLRNRATLVGNICNASPAGDTIGACLLLDGVLNIHGVDGYRQEPLGAFFLGPGKTKLNMGDIVTSIQFPLPLQGMQGKYIKHGRNNLSDLSIVGVTVLGAPDAQVPSGFRIRLALASVAPTPLVVKEVEQLLAQKAISPATILEAAQLAEKACNPITDVRGSARYRKQMVKNLSIRAISEICEKLNG
jgi:aerobic carbon-monoxide dehydrogenase medium subunit